MSIASMTGYARAEGRDPQMSWIWEAKSVNGRGLELRCRLPAGYDFLEPAVREAAGRLLKRGNVQISLTLNRQAEAAQVQVNTALLNQLLSVCAEWQGKFPAVAPARLDGLLAIKGVLEAAEGNGAAEDEAARAAREAALKATLGEALAALSSMRLSEGARLKAVLESQLDDIAALAARAGACAAFRPEAVRERLKAQVAAVIEAVPALSDERIAQEVALIAVKGDVREELDRLGAHVAAARELLQAGGAVGRKLDFLSQEFNREANTLCSKSADVELTRIGLDLKAAIDQFREQVQNLE